MKMESRPVRPTDPNRIADLAFQASIVNLVSWIPIAIPNVLNSIWGLIFLVAILLSTGIALGAGIWGLLKVKPSKNAVGRSLFGVMVGGINLLLIILSIIGIYAMANAPF